MKAVLILQSEIVATPARPRSGQRRRRGRRKRATSRPSVWAAYQGNHVAAGIARPTVSLSVGRPSVNISALVEILTLPSACPGGTDTVTTPPMVARLLTEEQVMTACSFGPVG